METRLATFRDLPALRGLWRGLWDAMVEAGCPLTFDRDSLDSLTQEIAAILQSPQFVPVVGEVEGQVVGMLLGEFQRRAFAKPEYYLLISSHYILPTHRGQSMSRALIHTFIAEAARRVGGAEQLPPDVEFTTVPGLDVGELRTWREALGFVPVETRYLAPVPPIVQGLLDAHPHVDTAQTNGADPHPDPNETLWEAGDA